MPNLDFHVYYTLQVLSKTVSKALELAGGEEASETAHFVGMVDKFFDALNVHNYTHGLHSRKRFQMPYTSSEDMRLKVHVQALLISVYMCIMWNYLYIVARR